MSGEGIIGLELHCLSALIKSIVDLGIEYRQLSSMKAADGTIHKADLIITDKNGRNIGFEKTAKGDYSVIADTSGLNPAQIKEQQNLIKKLRQRYSYNVVIDQLKKQGYVIAQEEKVQNNTIRLVARKWS
ncbi:MAG: DUF1257 domain-containing protein [Candidatus Omnitrophota bacterium]